MSTIARVTAEGMIEFKDFVRTPAGVQKYGQPIGSFIVKDPLKRIRKEGRIKGTGTLEDPIDVGKDLKLATTLIAKGKHVRLHQPDEVTIVLSKLAARAKYAVRKGNEAPNFNLCLISIPGTNLFCEKNKGIPRIEMPQLKGKPEPGSPAEKLPKGYGGEVNAEDAFRAALKASGIKLTRKRQLASHLRATQKELVGVNVAGIAKSMKKKGHNPLLDDPIFVTRDNYVLDGHHRWAARVANDAEDGKLGDIWMDTEVIDADIGAVLDYTNEFTKAIGIQQVGMQHLSQNLKDALVLLETKIAEAKAVRHVRTSGGVVHYGQPIGSVIVRDPIARQALRSLIPPGTEPDQINFMVGPRRSKLAIHGLLRKAVSDREGWDKYTDGPITRYVGKQGREWAVLEVDPDGTEQISVTASNKKDAVAEMHLIHFEDFEEKAKPFPRRTTHPKFNKKPGTIKRDRLHEARSEREIAEHMAKWKYSIPTTAWNVWLSDDPENPEVRQKAWWIQGEGAKAGKPQAAPNTHAVAKREERKWSRVSNLRDVIGKVDAQLTPEAVESDDTMATIAFMRYLGARVGSGDPATPGRGISELERGDVRFKPNGELVIDYMGKKAKTRKVVEGKAGHQHYETDDELLIGALKARLEKMPDDESARFFPDTNYTKSNARLKEITGNQEVGNHDLRRVFATEQAMGFVDNWPINPKSKKEFEAAVKEIGKFVDEMLNDKNQALKSYIDPTVFDEWRHQIGEK